MSPREELRIHDAHRVLGPVPHDAVPTVDVAGLLADLDDLGVASCSAVASSQLFGDPSGRNGASEGFPAEPRISPVPVIVPGFDDGVHPTATGAPMVRACPVRHRWSLDAGAAHRRWEDYAATGVVVAMDATEVGFGALRALASAHPDLLLLVLSPGYRELRRCAELLTDFERTYVETGTLNASGGVEWLAGVAGASRLVFGSGGPLLDDAGATYVLRSLELPDADVARIAWGTAADLGLVPA